MGPKCSDWDLSKREDREIQAQRDRERSAMGRQEETGVMQLQAKQCQGLPAPPEARKR